MKSLQAILVKDGLTEHSFQGITPSPKAEKCHPCVRYKTVTYVSGRSEIWHSSSQDHSIQKNLSKVAPSWRVR